MYICKFVLFSYHKYSLLKSRSVSNIIRTEIPVRIRVILHVCFKYALPCYKRPLDDERLETAALYPNHKL